MPINKANQKIVLAVVVAVLLLIAGIWWGGHPSDLPGVLRNAFVSNPNGTIVDQALADIEHDYFRRLSAVQLQNNAISGAIDGLGDPYAEYQTPVEFRGFGKAPAPSHFGGVGVVVVVVARGLLVQTVFAGSPAARGGVRPGDVIVAGDGRSFAGRSTAYSTDVIRGAVGSDVTLTIERGARRLTLTLERAVIRQTPVQLVAGHLVVFDHVKVAVIELATFEVTGIHTQVADALKRLAHCKSPDNPPPVSAGA